MVNPATSGNYLLLLSNVQLFFFQYKNVLILEQTTTVNLIKFPTTAEVETNAIEIRKYVMKLYSDKSEYFLSIKPESSPVVRSKPYGSVHSVGVGDIKPL